MAGMQAVLFRPESFGGNVRIRRWRQTKADLLNKHHDCRTGSKDSSPMVVVCIRPSIATVILVPKCIVTWALEEEWTMGGFPPLTQSGVQMEMEDVVETCAGSETRPMLCDTGRPDKSQLDSQTAYNNGFLVRQSLSCSICCFTIRSLQEHHHFLIPRRDSHPLGPFSSVRGTLPTVADPVPPPSLLLGSGTF